MNRKRHIVVVDDESNIGLSLRLILEGEGYRVSICESVARFSALRGLAPVDLYLLYVRLPDGNGIDLLRSLRQRDLAVPTGARLARAGSPPASRPLEGAAASSGPTPR